MTAPPPAPGGALPARRTLLAVALLLATSATLAWTGRAVLEYAAGDEFTYLALAESLEQGAYREGFRPSAPAHVQYPPGYPAWLVVVRLVSRDPAAIQVVNVLLLLLALAGTFHLAWRLRGDWFGLAVLLPLATNAHVLWMGGAYYSEALFTALTLSTLVAAARADDRQRSTVPVTLLSLAAFLTRAVGFSLVLAVGAWLAWRRRWRALAVHALVSVLVAGAWFAWTAFATPDEPTRSYGDEFFAGRHGESRGFLITLALRTLANARVYLTAVLPVELAQLSVPGTVLDNLAWLALNVACLGAGLWSLWRRWPLVTAYIVAFAAVLALWAWPIGRFFIPLVPLMYLTILLGAWGLSERLAARARVAARVSLVAVLSAGSLIGARAHVAALADCDRTAPEESAGCYGPASRALIAASRFVRDSTPPGSVVLAWQPAAVHFLSGKKAEPVTLALSVPPAEIAPHLAARSVTFALLTPISPTERQSMSRALLAACADYTVRARFEPDTYLLALRAPDPTSPDACDAIAGYRSRNPESVDNPR